MDTPASPTIAHIDLGPPFGEPTPDLVAEQKILQADKPLNESPDIENRSNQKMLQVDKLLQPERPPPPPPPDKPNDAAKANTKAVRSSSGTSRPRITSSSSAESTKRARGELIMDTNKSSIVSKRSVEKLYYQGQPEYYRHFVTKFKRRSPLVNRGYWLRMQAIEHAVSLFLSERQSKKKVVVNLGCGYAPLPFIFLGRHADLCHDTTFVDVDYPVLMQKKLSIIEKTEELRSLLPKLTRTAYESGVLASSDPYVLVGCDLTDINPLHVILNDHLHLETSGAAIMFVSEVATAYMDTESSQAVFDWAASFEDTRFCLLEQHLPDGIDHPFAQTMMAHFEKMQAPLRGICTIDEMKHRFISAGFPAAATECRSLWEVWLDPLFLTDEQRRALDHVEQFDEWEDFALFASHYFILVAEKDPGRTYKKGRNLRASMFVSSNRVSSVATYAKLDVPQYHFGPGDSLNLHELKEPHDFRRFAAVLPPTASDEYGDTIGLHGGLGKKDRMQSSNTYARVENAESILPPPLTVGIMCHTITRLGSTSNCVLVGGRTSPENASAACWIRLDDDWRRISDLPTGRYRHCAVPLVLPTEPRPAHTVLVFGGRTGDGLVLDEWLIWAGETGWQAVTVMGESPPARFGAAMITDSRESISGVLVGGMTSAGRVLNDFWHWELHSDMTLHCRNVTSRATAFLKGDSAILGRFGAQLIRSNRGILMIGGITAGRMLTRQDEILNLKTLRPQPIQGPRPLFIGFAIQDVDGGLMVLGGGVTCFSFGTTWNRSCILNDAKPENFEMEWRLVETHDAEEPTQEQVKIYSGHHSSDEPPWSGLPTPIHVYETRLDDSSPFDFTHFVALGKPAVLRNCNLGACTEKWTSAYLKENVGPDRRVSIHAASSERMDFRTKNFEYRTQAFGEFLDAVDAGERLYLRSLAKDAPSDQPANLAHDFPQIAADFALPPELAVVIDAAGAQHSSPLRIAGPVNMWLHYDVMANVLCQVRGRKRVMLFPPQDVTYLGFEAGASSSSIDVFGVEGWFYRGLLDTRPHEVVLEPGDVLFIPPLWIHAAAPISAMAPADDDDGGSGSGRTMSPSVAVNVFFRNLELGYAAGRDVYANRDLAAYEKGRKDLAKMIKTFDDLPAGMGGFYMERLAIELLEKARAVSRTASLHSVIAELPITDPPAEDGDDRQ